MPIKTRDAMRVAVLAGGISEERDVSLASGAHALRALRQAGFGDVRLWDPADPAQIASLRDSGCDAAFIALHGRGGEDGMIQSVLEYLHIPYTGSGVTASACAGDKHVAKIIYAHAGIPIARGLTLERGEAADADAILGEMGPASFVKPVANGSSIGVSLARSPGELRDAVALAFESSDRVLIEERLVGTEITVGVLGGSDPRALPIVEIMRQPGGEFYDRDVKYIDPALVHRIPAVLEKGVSKQAERLALSAHEALGCFGLSRSDFIVTSRGPVILETNTIPGMTEASLFPDEIRHAGMEFSEFCAELIDLALERAGA